MTKIKTFFETRYSRAGLINLFLACALPLHVWSLFLALRDIDWLTKRTNFFDAIGVVSYGLLFALVESLVIFFIFMLLGALISPVWSEDKRIALLSLMAYVLSLWAMAGQVYFVYEWKPPGALVEFLLGSGHPLRYLYGFELFFILLTTLPSAWFMLFFKKFANALQSLFERLILLSAFYLLMDVFALIIVLMRNL